METKGWGGGKEKQVPLLYPRHGFSPELWAFKLLGLWAPSRLDFETLINSLTFPHKKHLLTTNSVSPGPSSVPNTELKQPGLSPWQAQRLLMGYFMVPSSRHGFPALSVVPIEGRVCGAERPPYSWDKLSGTELGAGKDRVTQTTRGRGADVAPPLNRHSLSL